MDLHAVRQDYIGRFARAKEHLLMIEELCRREPDATLRKNQMQKISRLIDASGRAVLGGDVFVVTAADLDTMPAVKLWFALAHDPVTGREAITMGEGIDRLNALDWRDGVPVNGMLLDLIMSHHVRMELMIGLQDAARFWRPAPYGLGTPVESFLSAVDLTRRVLAGARVIMTQVDGDPTFTISDLPPCHRIGYARLGVVEERA